MQPDTPEVSREPATAMPANSARPIRVVIADDNLHIRHILRFLLGTEDRFVVVGEATNGAEVMERVAGADVVIMDIRMPHFDGLSALEELRVLHPEVAVVIYSSYDQPYLQAEAHLRGAAAFVSKTAPIEDLASVIREVANTVGPGRRPATASRRVWRPTGW